MNTATMRSNRLRIAAVLVAVMLVAVSASAALADDAEAEATVEDEDEVYEFAILAVFAIGLIVYGAGVLTGYMLADSDDEPATPAVSSEAVYQQLRALYADKYTTAWDTALNLVTSVMPADTTLWSFTTSYWDRATELAVADAWSLDADYDADAMIANAQLRANLANYIYVWQAAVDQAYNWGIAAHQQFTGDCYGNMTMSFAYDGGSITLDTGDDAYVDLLEVVDGTVSGTQIYLDTSTEDDSGNYDPTTSGTVHVFGRDVTLRDTDGVTYTLTVGANDVTGMDSGIYTIETSGATICGPISMSGGDKAADVLGGMVLVSGSDSVYVLADGDGVVIGDGATTVSSTTLAIEISYTGESGSTKDVSYLCDGADYNLIRDWNAMISQIGYVVEEAAQAGETVWGIFDATEEASSLVSPSSITSTIESLGLGLTTAQSQALYIQSLTQLADYYAEHEGDLTGMDVSISAASLDLYCYGTVYYNGSVWAEGVVFTPYTLGSGMTLTLGENTLGANAYAMIWAQVDDYSDWTGTASLSNYALLDLSEGYTIDVESIHYMGESVEEVTLATQTIVRDSSGGNDEDEELIDPVETLDAGVLVMVIILELAVIVALLGYTLGSPTWGLILAVIVAIIALLFSDSIAGWLAS